MNTIKKQQVAVVLTMLLGVATAGQLQAQQELQVQNSFGSLGNAATTIRPFNLGTVGVKGSPFLLPVNVPGEITLGSGRKLTTGRFNYDVMERQLTVKLSSRDSVRYQGTDVKQIIFQPQNQPPIRLEHFPDLTTTEPALKTELVRVIFQGTYSLVQLPLRKFLKTSTSQTYAGQAKRGDEYYDDSAYYLIRPDRTAERVKLTRKSLTKALKEQGPLLDTYLKSNLTDLDNELDVAKALASLDQK